MESRSCGTTPEGSRRPQHTVTSRPPRVGPAAADRRLLMTVDIVKGPSGFGFTLAETEQGQVIKDVVDPERCRGVSPGDVVVAINNLRVRDWSHDDVVNVLRSCRVRRPARLTLMTSRRDAPPRRDISPVRYPAGGGPPRPTTALASPLAADDRPDPTQQRVDYSQLYRRLYSPAPVVRGGTPVSSQPATNVRSPNVQRIAAPERPHGYLTASNGSTPDVVLLPAGSHDVVGGPSMSGQSRRQQPPRRSLPTQPASVDLLSPLMPRRVSETSQNSLNFSGTPDFIPASAYLENDDRRRRATGRPSAECELAALTLNDPGWSRTDDVFPSPTTKPPAPALIGQPTNGSLQSFDADDASLPSNGSFPNGAVPGLPVTSQPTSGYIDRRTPATFVGAGHESCNGYNARTAALHSAGAAKYQPTGGDQRLRSQSALGEAIGPGRGPHRGPKVRLSVDGGYEERAAEKTDSYPTGSLDRRALKLAEAQPQPLPHDAVSSTSVNGRLAAETGRSTDDHVPAAAAGASTSPSLYQVELHRGSRGFGFAIRGGQEFSSMPITVLNIASGGSAHMDGRLRSEDEVVSINGVSTDAMTHSDAVQLIQNSPSPLQLVMRKTNHAAGRMARPKHYLRSPMTGVASRRMASPSRGPVPVAVPTPPVNRRPTLQTPHS